MFLIFGIFRKQQKNTFFIFGFSKKKFWFGGKKRKKIFFDFQEIFIFEVFIFGKFFILLFFQIFTKVFIYNPKKN